MLGNAVSGYDGRGFVRRQCVQQAPAPKSSAWRGNDRLTRHTRRRYSGGRFMWWQRPDYDATPNAPPLQDRKDTRLRHTFNGRNRWRLVRHHGAQDHARPMLGPARGARRPVQDVAALALLGGRLVRNDTAQEQATANPAALQDGEDTPGKRTA
jgi:hypothetical protein